MPPALEPLHQKAGHQVLPVRRGRMPRALRLLGVLAIAAMLAACGRCGDFLSSSLSQIGACHSDHPPQ